MIISRYYVPIYFPKLLSNFFPKVPVFFSHIFLVIIFPILFHFPIYFPQFFFDSFPVIISSISGNYFRPLF